ncbi:MAG: c-type cytochrome [Magnetococcales bacterium]|nr:c-type cytochrome [Magnetococcales bacterium]
MATTAQTSLQWMDKYWLATGQQSDLRRLPSLYQEEMTTVGAVYRKSALQYLPADRLDHHLYLIFAFMAWVYAREKPVREVTEDDLSGYFVWLARQGCPMAQWSLTAGAVTDFLQVLRQEGILQRNPLRPVYKIFMEREQLLHSVLTQATPYPFDPPTTSPRVAPTTTPTVTDRVTTARPKPVQATPAPAPRTIVPPVVWQTIHTHKTVLRTLALLLLVGLLLHYCQVLTERQPTTGTTTSTPNPGSVTEPRTKGAVSTRQPKPDDTRPRGMYKDPIVDFFYQNGMKDYYCRDYRQTPCVSTQVLRNPIPVDPENIYEGGDQYMGMCGRCHGDAGRGNGLDAIRLNQPLTPLSRAGGDIPDRDAYLFWIVAAGGSDFGGQMPPFKDLLDENKIWKVILFLRTLR